MHSAFEGTHVAPVIQEFGLELVVGECLRSKSTENSIRIAHGEGLDHPRICGASALSLREERTKPLLRGEIALEHAGNEAAVAVDIIANGDNRYTPILHAQSIGEVGARKRHRHLYMNRRR